jgi:pimeloyl-ACP methyl ester carboxylesterase
MLVVRDVSATCPRRPGLYGVAMAVTRKLLTAGSIGAAAATAAGLGVRARGQRIANTTDPELDPLLEAPEGVGHHRLATFDGGAVHVAELGQGPPVMLCHGVTLQWDVWSPLFRLLAEDHRVLAWDMRGHGESHAGDEGVSLRAVATDLVTVLSTLDVSDAVVVGHSMGGMALARTFIDHNAAARRRIAHGMFLATSAAPMHPVAHDPNTFRHQAAVAFATGGMGSRLRYDWRSGNLSRVLLSRAFGVRATGAAVEQLRAMTADMPPDSLTQAAHAIVKHDVREQLAGSGIHSSVVTGTLDRLTPPRHGRVLADSLGADSQLDLLEGVGHQVMQEDPWTLAELIRKRAVSPSAA